MRRCKVCAQPMEAHDRRQVSAREIAIYTAYASHPSMLRAQVKAASRICPLRCDDTKAKMPVWRVDPKLALAARKANARA